MSAFTKVALLTDVPPGAPVAVTVQGRALALYQLDGEVYATDALCTHAHVNLCEGDIEGCAIVCPLHFGSFDIKTGHAIDPPACEDLKTYDAKIVDGDIHVAL
jgi:naphthalene 1,2-dioxygenase system ferredoxin subunit